MTYAEADFSVSTKDAFTSHMDEHHTPKLTEPLLLDSSYQFAGIRFKPLRMMFARDTADGGKDYQYLSFEDGLRQPLEMIEPDPAELLSTLEYILWQKQCRDFSADRHEDRVMGLTNELRERFGMSPSGAFF